MCTVRLTGPNRAVYNRGAWHTRTPRQLANRRRVEGLIGLAAPLLDGVLFTGDRLSRVAWRYDVDPDLLRLGRRTTAARCWAARRARLSAAASIPPSEARPFIPAAAARLAGASPHARRARRRPRGSSRSSSAR